MRPESKPASCTYPDHEESRDLSYIQWLSRRNLSVLWSWMLFVPVGVLIWTTGLLFDLWVKFQGEFFTVYRVWVLGVAWALIICDGIAGGTRARIDPDVEWDWERWDKTMTKLVQAPIVWVTAILVDSVFATDLYLVVLAMGTIAAKEGVSVFQNVVWHLRSVIDRVQQVVSDNE